MYCTIFIFLNINVHTYYFKISTLKCMLNTFKIQLTKHSLGSKAGPHRFTHTQTYYYIVTFVYLCGLPAITKTVILTYLNMYTCLYKRSLLRKVVDMVKL